jgi:hypothetical protein
VSELNRIHIHAQCVNWSAGISYPHSRAIPLIGSFCWGLLIVTADKGKTTGICYSDLVHWLLFSGVSYCDNRERVFMFDYYTKEKEHRNTRQSLLQNVIKPNITSFSVIKYCSVIMIYQI